MLHSLVQNFGSAKSCFCGSHVVKSYVCDASGEVIDIVFKCEVTMSVIDLQLP